MNHKREYYPLSNEPALCWWRLQPVCADGELLRSVAKQSTIYVYSLLERRRSLVWVEALSRMSPLEALAHAHLLPE
jgi:hypothetical protein